MSVLIEIWEYLLGLTEQDLETSASLTPIIPPNG